MRNIGTITISLVPKHKRVRTMKVLWFCLVLTILNPIEGFFIPPKTMRIFDGEIREISSHPTMAFSRIPPALAHVNPGYQSRLAYFDYPPIKSFVLEELMKKMTEWENQQDLRVGRLPLNPVRLFRY